MTLNLSYARFDGVFLVTDRLLTTESGRRPFDVLANKNVVYWARDAMVAIGYTGAAYLDGLTSDRWIVEKLTGCDLQASGRPESVRIGALPQWLDVGLSIRLLAEELGRVKRPHPLQFELIIAGWYWGRHKRTRPMAWWVGSFDKPGMFETGHLPRHWHLRKRARLGATPGSNISAEDLRSLAEKMPAASSAEEIQEILVNGMRLVAQKNKSVGPHCMSISLPNPDMMQFVRTRYVPLGSQTAVVTNKEASRELPAAFSPWVVGQGMIAPPAILIGGATEIHMGPFTVFLEAPENSEHVYVMSGQRRPKPP